MEKHFFIRTLIRESLKNNFPATRLDEFVVQDEVYLLQYLNQSEEDKKKSLPYDFPYFFNDFLIEEDIDFEYPTHNIIDADGENIGEKMEDYEAIEWISANNPELFNKYADYLYDRVLNNTLLVPEYEYPAWSYFSSGSIVKNQWLIHFTSEDNAWEIYRKGFLRGVEDITKLGLTTSLGEFEKKYGGFNFSYTIPDFKEYAKSSGYGREYKYGNAAVLFRASGVRTWHYGDQEYQTIFFGNTARDIIPIKEGSNGWEVYSSKGNIKPQSELKNLVDWLVHNYEQYKKVIR